MNELAFQLMSLQYELAMNMGSTLELPGMLRSVLEALLRRLDGRAAAVFDLSAEGGRPQLCIAMPSDFEASEDLLDSVQSVPFGEGFSPRMQTLQDGGFRHVFELPGFGVLAFEHAGAALDPRVLGALQPLMGRLGRAALACADHGRVQAAQRMFSALVETLPEVVFEARIEPDGSLHFEYVSPRAHEVLGVQPAALVETSRHLIERICDEDRVALEATLARAARQGQSFEQRLRMHEVSGEYRWLLIAASPRDLGNQPHVTRWSGFIQDVTARELLVASRQALAHAQLASVLTSVADAVIGANEAGLITHWNRGAEQLLGYSETDALGQPLSMIVPEGFRESHRRGFEHHLLTGETRVVGQPVELPALHADGHEIPVELMLSRAEAGGTTLFFGVLRDLTARKEAQRERERMIEQERRFAAALVEVGRVLTVSTELPIERVTEVVAETLDVARVSVWSLTEHSLVCRDLFVRAEGHHSTGLEIGENGVEPYFESLRAQRIVNAPDVLTHPATACFWGSYLEPLDIVSVLDVPLRADDFDGVFSLESTERREWSPDEVRFCVGVAELVGRAMEREQRARAEARSQAILRSIGDAVIACDANHRITLMNPMAEHLTGWSMSEGIGRHLDDVFRVSATQADRPAAPEEESIGQDSPSWLIRSDGERLPISQNTSAIAQSDETGGLVITFRDIREELESRRALEHQFRQLRSIGEAIPDLLFTVRNDGTLRYIQSRPSEDLLAPMSEQSEWTLSNLFDEALSRELGEAVANALNSQAIQTIEYTLELPQGLQRFEARFAPMSDDEVTALVRNVTTEHERARLLEEERARLQAVLASTSAILYAARLPSFELEYISDSATHTLGFPLSEFKQPGFWENALHPDDKQRVLTGLGGLAETGSHTHEYRHRHADGSYRWVRDEVRLIRDENGAPVRAIGASFDISERKTAERRLSAALELQRYVSDLSTALLSEDLQDSDALVESALGRVAGFANADRAYVFRMGDQAMFNTHEWCRAGVAPQKSNRQGVSALDFDFVMGPLNAGNPVILNSVSDQLPEDNSARAMLEAKGINTLFAVPLQYEGQLQGFLGLDNPRVELVDELEDLATPLRIFAEVVAGGLKRAEDERELRTLNARIESRVAQQRALLDLSAALPMARTRGELNESLKHRLGGVLGSSRVSLMTLNDDRTRVRISLLDIDAKAPVIPDDTYVNDQLPDVERDIETLRPNAVWKALQNGETVSTFDTDLAAYPDWVYLSEKYGLDHFVIVPLVGTDGVFGCFNVCFARVEPVTREEVDWVGQVGSLLAAHIAAHEAREALEQLNLALEARVEARTAELRSSEERFTKLFRQAPQAMVIADADGKIVRTNAKAEALFGGGQKLPDGIAIEALVPETSRGEHAEMVRDFFHASSNREMADSRMVSAIRLDGTTFCAEIGLVVMDHDGTPFVIAGVTDVTARVEAQAAVVQSLREKETMLREIHHRVKNNLQIISSLLMLQIDQMPPSEARELLTQSVLRVRSMALIHQQLYGVESLEKIDLGDYARALSESLRSVLMPSARLHVDAGVAEVTINDAVPLGLILNELVTNAFKYGIPQEGTPDAERVGRAGEGVDMRIEVGARDGTLRLAVLDSGIGLPEGFDPNRATSLGLHLVRALTRQLRGKLEYDSDQGSRFVLTCPHPG